MEVTYIFFNKIKRNSYYSFIPPFNMNEMTIFNLVFKIKKAKLRKAIRCIVLKWHIHTCISSRYRDKTSKLHFWRENVYHGIRIQFPSTPLVWKIAEIVQLKVSLKRYFERKWFQLPVIDHSSRKHDYDLANVESFLACRSRQASIVLERYFRFEVSLLYFYACERDGPIWVSGGSDIIT